MVDSTVMELLAQVTHQTTRPQIDCFKNRNLGIKELIQCLRTYAARLARIFMSIQRNLEGKRTNLKYIIKNECGYLKEYEKTDVIMLCLRTLS